MVIMTQAEYMALYNRTAASCQRYAYDGISNRPSYLTTADHLKATLAYHSPCTRYIRANVLTRSLAGRSLAA